MFFLHQAREDESKIKRAVAKAAMDNFRKVSGCVIACSGFFDGGEAKKQRTQNEDRRAEI